ncbi:MAG: IS66 family transposase [Gammaproteobacteria bacterium]|nr:IS66 family transposase [Gammaproteobacteria bacterium]
MRFLFSFIFNDLRPLKMAALPCAAGISAFCRDSLAQSDLFFNEAEARAALSVAPETEATRVEVPSHSRKRGGRKPLDAGLPRMVVRHELPASERVCPHDGAVLREMGVETAEQPDIVPALIRVIRHERVKYACPCCVQGVRVAPGPLRLLPKSQLSEAALAWVITAKYQDALPLYRQAAILRRFGGDIARHTLAHSVIRAGQAVTPLINLLRDRLFDAAVLHGDETELQVLKEDGRAATSKSYLWLQLTGTGPPVRLFTYAPSRSAKTALDLYAGAKGVLVTDGYEVYDVVARTVPLSHLGCWAQARRRLVEAEDLIPVAARAKGLAANARRALRQRDSAPLLARIKHRVEVELHGVAPQSLLGKALHYLNEQWPKLVRFLEDGDYPLDNNAAENALRPFVIGRENWLFADTVKGAQASANLYSLIETAKANGLEPYRYLCHVFNALPAADTVEKIEALLPWAVALREDMAVPASDHMHTAITPKKLRLVDRLLPAYFKS